MLWYCFHRCVFSKYIFTFVDENSAIDSDGNSDDSDDKFDGGSDQEADSDAGDGEYAVKSVDQKTAELTSKVA